MIISNEVLFMGLFIIFIVAILMIDLLFVGRNSDHVSLKEAGTWSLIWISLAMLFSILLRYFGEIVHGIETMDDLTLIVQKYAPELKLTGITLAENIDIYRKYMTISYLTGYLIEETLSTDNLFVMLMILTAFNVKPSSYKSVLLWGILGAIVLRFGFIFAGSALIQRFEWILFIFGAYLIYAGVEMFIKRHSEEKIDPQHHWLVKLSSRWFKVFPRYVGKNFFIRKDGKIHITPLLVVVIIIEFSDLIFAADSIPAIFSITRDPYVVFFSNIFAILGLRSLFFLLAHVVKLFYYLKTGISVLLGFIGFKLLFHTWLEEIGFQSIYSLYFILIVLFLSIGFSLLKKKSDRTKLADAK
jgi:tellurite resistance protein TerC